MKRERTVTDKTEEQLEKERNAVDAMRNAKSNMTAALDRIATLERALETARTEFGNLKQYIPKGAFTYRGANTCQGLVDESVQKITKALGS